jgi:hypothetical protein
MSKRITLTDFEVEQILRALEVLRDDTPTVRYEVVFVGQRFYNKLIDKLKTEPSISKASAGSVKQSITENKK